MKTKITLPYILGGLIALATLSETSAGNPHGDSLSDSAKPVAPKNIIKQDTLKWQDIVPRAVNAYRHGQKDVMYIMNTGDSIRRSGGSLAWRNNNPGNLVYGPKTQGWGAIGKGPRGFAIFPDEQTGRNALDSLLRTSYANMSIVSTIYKYAPPHENDVRLYLNRLKGMTGLNLNTKIGNLNADQMDKVKEAICVIEGWREGDIEERPSVRKLVALKKSACDILFENLKNHTM